MGSIKTRIETPNKPPPDGEILHWEMGSIKTRIETPFRLLGILFDLRIGKWVPLKQGLKPTVGFLVAYILVLGNGFH